MRKKLLLAAVLAVSASNVFAASNYSYEIISDGNKNPDLKQLNQEASDYLREVKKYLTDAALTDDVGKVIYLTQKKEATIGSGAVVCLRHVTLTKGGEKALYRLSSAVKNAMGRVTNPDDLKVFLSGTKEVLRTNADKAASKGATKKEKAFLELKVGTQFQFVSDGKTFQGEVILKPGKSLCFARVEVGGAGGGRDSGDGRDNVGGDESGRGDNFGGDEDRGRSRSSSRDSGSRSSSSRGGNHDNYADNGDSNNGDNYGGEGRRSSRDRD